MHHYICWQFNLYVFGQTEESRGLAASQCERQAVFFIYLLPFLVRQHRHNSQIKLLQPFSKCLLPVLALLDFVA